MTVTASFQLTPTTVLDIPSGIANVAITSLAGGGAAAMWTLNSAALTPMALNLVPVQ